MTICVVVFRKSHSYIRSLFSCVLSCSVALSLSPSDFHTFPPCNWELHNFALVVKAQAFVRYGFSRSIQWEHKCFGIGFFNIFIFDWSAEKCFLAYSFSHFCSLCDESNNNGRAHIDKINDRVNTRKTSHCYSNVGHKLALQTT